MRAINMKIIESKDNKTYKNFLNIKKGKSEENEILIEGEDLVDEAIKAHKLKYLIINDKNNAKNVDVETYLLKDSLYRELSSYKSLPKMIGIASYTMCKASELGERVIYLDNVQDPGNVGTIIRSALSFNYTGVMLSFDTASLYNSKVVQATKGALFHINIAQGELSELNSLNYHIYLTTLDGVDERSFTTLPEPFAIVMGNEGQGVSKKNLNYGTKMKIEMSGIDSLNVAIAASIFMYRFKK